MYVRPRLGGEHGRLGLGHLAASATNLVLISGGPGLYDYRDVEHDMSWANYVTAPLLLAKKGIFSGRSDVLWLIYRPAYVDRWDDDVKARRTEVRRVRKLGFDSYVAMLNGRAHTRNWHLIWFESAGDLWNRLARLRDPIGRVWYWGHAAKSGLWLTLSHTRSARPQRPAADAVVTVKSISDHESLRFRFPRRQRHRFVGAIPPISPGSGPVSSVCPRRAWKGRSTSAPSSRPVANPASSARRRGAGLTELVPGSPYRFAP